MDNKLYAIVEDGIIKGLTAIKDNGLEIDLPSDIGMDHKPLGAWRLINGKAIFDKSLLDAMQAQQLLEENKQIAREYLVETDWYIIRKFERKRYY